uniref:Putative secreted peptide n=1 Tax=Anopheles braziliensis TaxID=58242 RepID=A0A2M3ZX97_9DIPT
MSALSCLVFAVSVSSSSVLMVVAPRSGGDLLKKSMILACFIWELQSPGLLTGLIASASSDSLRFLRPFPLLVATAAVALFGEYPTYPTVGL